MRFLALVLAPLLAIGGSAAALDTGLPTEPGGRTTATAVGPAGSDAGNHRPPDTGSYRPPDTGSYRLPVAGPARVLRGFSPPATPYGPGHLGVDLAVDAGAVVLAAQAGVVRFAGQVAGRGVVVIEHPDGISTEYEPVGALVRRGERVMAGRPIGRRDGVHRGCPAAGCLHWGARRDGRYLDPMSLLRPLGVVRLLPWDWVPPD
ncbi:MAG: murein hydrolase activator EnvC family protein [Jatrophihabitantaceae bacterium]